ncbi:MAG: flagellar motor switch protein FliM [Candidatus Delongbacteria bacterium]|nr:flagellar motor switch protein FliM [Candidatus Delongbacteria bacterium]
MSEILSQEEVDALLSAVSSGQLEIDKVKEEALQKTVTIYDFKHPDRVSKDQVRTLQMLHDGFARAFSSTLSAHLRTIVDIDLVSVDQITYSEFIMSMSDPSCIYIFSLKPIHGNAILEITPQLAFSIFDRLFGGQGQTLELNRELTGIEQIVVSKVVNFALKDLSKAWEHVVSLDMKLESRETNPQFVQVAPPGETVILISFEIKTLNSSGLMSICYPYMLLESIISKLSGQHWITFLRKDSATGHQIVLTNRLLETRAPCTIILGKTGLSVKDLIELNVGDVVNLKKEVKDELPLYVGNFPKFYCIPGVYKDHFAVKITRPIKKGEEVYL